MQRENTSLSSLKYTDYTIADNVLRAYFNDAGDLVFVLDSTVSGDKQNTLLVMSPDGDRKWDEILSIDYGINLETIRPKTDNRYQKLDIDYTGLAIYDALIRAYNAGEDLSGALSSLNDFRDTVLRRTASERLAVAQHTIATARETIDRANESIGNLRNRLGELNKRVKTQRASVGHEPTKQSASKILRTESQIDATNEKLSRAQRRLNNAERRLNSALSDADAARAILNKHTTQGATMAEDDVKPLFDTDPNIMDQDIAFKPIEFGKNAAQPESAPASATIDENISFTPPVSPATPLNPVPITPNMSDDVTPELDETFTTATDDVMEPAPIVSEPEPTPSPVLNSIKSVDKPIESPAPGYVPNNTPNAPVADGFRPVSPATGVYSAPVASTVPPRKQQNVFYYMLLIVLIILSVFTLWMYQKSTSTSATPQVLSEPTAPVSDVQRANSEPVVQITELETPIIVAASTEPEPVTEPARIIPDTETMIINAEIAKPTPAASNPEPVAAVINDKPADFTINTIFETPATVIPEPVVIDEDAIIATKPAYNAGSLNDEMFVSESDYDEYETPGCADGAAPDAYGCCPGEAYTDMGDGFACCSDTECFAPLDM